MKETRRLSDSSPNPLTRALLRSGRGDAPSEDARRHAAIAIGVAGVVAASSGMAGGGATGAAAASKWIASATLLKWAGATIVAATLAAGGVLATELVSQRSQEAPPPQASRAVRPGAVRATASAVRSSAPAVSAEALQPAAAPSERPPAPARSAPEPAATPIDDGSALRGELHLVDRARLALSDDRPERALAELEAYRRAFPRGALANEAAVLRIEALARSGREEAAAREARALLARDPGSPHARRVRGLLASMGSEDGAR